MIYQLGQLELIETTRGRERRYYLAKEPIEIIIWGFVRKIEEDFRLVECFGPDNKCVITPVCGLRLVLHEALEVYLAVLDKYTLADLIKQPELYRSLLKTT